MQRAFQHKTLPLVLVIVVAIIAIAIIFWRTTDSANPITLLPKSSSTISFTTLANGSYSTNPSGNIVITSQSDLEKIWPALLGDIPAVDFNNEIVIGVFSEEKNTGGYDIKVQRIQQGAYSAVVTVLETSPGSNCFVTQEFTTPYHIIKTQKLDDSIRFETKRTKQSCED